MTDEMPGTPVDLPLTPEFAETLGYKGMARFVGFAWQPSGDELVYEDGRSSGSAQSWAWLAYRRHRSVAPLLDGWELGASDADPEHILLLDRETNRATIATPDEACPFLHSQWPPEPPLSEEQRQAIRAEIERLLDEQMRTRPEPADIQRMMDEQRGRVARMIAWLDQCPNPPSEGRAP